MPAGKIAFLLAGSLLLSSCLTDIRGSGSSTPKKSSVVIIPEDATWSQRMALSIIKEHPEPWTNDFRDSPRWTYTHGLIMLSMQRLWQHSGDERYWEYAKEYADTMIDPQGKIRDYDVTEFNIDHVNPGKMLFLLYERSGDIRYRRAMASLREQLHWQPRTTDGGYWHKLRYPWQMWLDGLYMGSPYLAEYGKKFEEPAAFDEVVHQLTLVAKHTLDPQTGLLRHGWDESHLQRWADPQTGQSPHIWGRSVGWYLMALVDVLDHLPADHPGRAEVLDMLAQQATVVASHQNAKTGLWYQVMDLPEREGNYEEASATCMFAYALARGANRGYLDKAHMATAQKAFQGLIDHLITVDSSGAMTISKCCSVAGLGGEPYRDGSFEYYISEPVRNDDPKATGPFILASLEFEQAGIVFSKSSK